MNTWQLGCLSENYPLRGEEIVMKVWAKSSISLLLALFVVLSISGWLSIRDENRALNKLMQEHGRSVSHAIATFSIEAMLSEDFPMLDTFLDAFGEKSKDISFIEVAQNGKVVSSYHRNDSSISEFDVFSSNILFSFEQNKPGEKIGEVKLGLFNNKYKLITDARLRDLIITIGATFAALALMVTILINKLIKEPIRRLVKGIQNVSGGDLTKQVEISSKDEFGELATTFNNMTRDLQRITVSKEYVDNIIASMNDALILVNPDFTIKAVNRAAVDLLGYKEDEIVEKPVSIIFEEDDSLEKLKINDLAENGFISGAEKTLQSKDGVKIPTLFSASAMEGVDGKFQGIICVALDITERKKMEKEGLKAQKLESVGVLAGGIAHDFNNILTTILGNAHLSIMRVKPEEDIYRNLKNIEKGVSQAKDLTQQLLTFSKGGAPVKKLISIEKLLKESTAFALRGSNVVCEYYLEDGLYHINADEGQLNQVIGNMVINAQHAMPQGGLLKVKASNVNGDNSKELVSLKHGKSVKISIEDNGCGAPKGILSKIFDPYFTTKQGGSGLGLASSYSIVKNHGGLITVESELDVGTTFTIYLPASSKEADAMLEGEDKPIFGNGKILIMDDDEAIRDMAGQTLGFIGYEVELSKDGAEAVDIYKRAKEAGDPFDVVIMDLTIPGGIGGKDAILMLREIEPEVKAIVFSGYSNDPVMADYKKYGFNSVITKPFEIKEMNDTLQKMING